MGTDDGKVGHANFFLCAFLEQAHVCDAGLLSREATSHDLEQSPIDLVNDLQVARQEKFKPGDRPFLKRFGKERVVCVSQRLLSETPGLLPAEMRFVKQ